MNFVLLLIFHSMFPSIYKDANFNLWEVFSFFFKGNLSPDNEKVPRKCFLLVTNLAFLKQRSNCLITSSTIFLLSLMY